MPKSEEIQAVIQPNYESKSIVLTISISSPGWIIKSVILYNEDLFKSSNGLYVDMLTQSQNQVSIELESTKFSEQLIEGKLVVG